MLRHRECSFLPRYTNICNFFFFGETKGASWDCKTTHSLLMKDTNFLELHASMQFSFFSGYKM